MERLQLEWYTEKKRILNTITKLMAQEVGKKINKIYINQITRFYEDPIFPNSGSTPVYYNRGYNLYRGYSGFYENPYKRIAIGHWQSGITIDASYIGNNPYHQDLEYVFGRAYKKGIHGINRNDFINRGWKITGSRVPKNTTPSPEREMNKKFKELTKKDNLDKIFDKYAKKLGLDD